MTKNSRLSVTWSPDLEEIRYFVSPSPSFTSKIKEKLGKAKRNTFVLVEVLDSNYANFQLMVNLMKRSCAKVKKMKHATTSGTEFDKIDWEELFERAKEEFQF